MSTSRPQQPEQAERAGTEERAEHAAHLSHIPPGNPIFTCAFIPPVPCMPSPLWGTPQNLMFKTTNNSYGLHAATYESSPCTFHPTSKKFSEALSKAGMYRNNSFNTSLKEVKKPKPKGEAKPDADSAKP